MTNTNIYCLLNSKLSIIPMTTCGHESARACKLADSGRLFNANNYRVHGNNCIMMFLGC